MARRPGEAGRVGEGVRVRLRRCGVGMELGEGCGSGLDCERGRKRQVSSTLGLGPLDRLGRLTFLAVLSLGVESGDDAEHRLEDGVRGVAHADELLLREVQRVAQAADLALERRDLPRERLLGVRVPIVRRQGGRRERVGASAGRVLMRDDVGGGLDRRRGRVAGVGRRDVPRRRPRICRVVVRAVLNRGNES